MITHLEVIEDVGPDRPRAGRGRHFAGNNSSSMRACNGLQRIRGHQVVGLQGAACRNAIAIAGGEFLRSVVGRVSPCKLQVCCEIVCRLDPLLLPFQPPGEDPFVADVRQVEGRGFEVQLGVGAVVIDARRAGLDGGGANIGR